MAMITLANFKHCRISAILIVLRWVLLFCGKLIGAFLTNWFKTVLIYLHVWYGRVFFMSPIWLRKVKQYSGFTFINGHTIL